MSRDDSKRARHRQRQAALRARRSRARRRAGMCVFHVEADQRRTLAALRVAGCLADDASQEQIARALMGVIGDFCARWLGKKVSVRVTRQGAGQVYAAPMRPLVPEDREREAEQARRREYVKRLRAELASGRGLETREDKIARRTIEWHRWFMRELSQLDPRDSGLALLPKAFATFQDLIDGQIAIAIDEWKRDNK